MDTSNYNYDYPDDNVVNLTWSVRTFWPSFVLHAIETKTNTTTNNENNEKQNAPLGHSGWKVAKIIIIRRILCHFLAVL